jgi:hypothetical protein
MKNFLSLFPFILGLIVAVFLMNIWLKDWNSQGSGAQDFALGLQNTAFFAQDSEYHFHCSDFIERTLHNCIEDYQKKASPAPIVLYLGNSQLHGINQPNLGLNSSSQIIYKHLKKKNKNQLVTLSMPNISLQEQYATYEYASTKLPVKVLLLAVSFDNTRESGVRDGLIELFSDKLTTKNLSKTLTGSKLLSDHGEKENAGNDLAALKETQQEYSEKRLNELLGEKWESWDKRGGLRSYLIIKIYQFRNYIFGIDSSSTRNKILARYEENFQALDDLLNLTKYNKIKTIVYSVPLRKDVKIPYDPVEYKEFLYDLQSHTEKAEAIFYNLEDLVPAEYWGTVDGINATGGKEEIDFMHFQAGGHELLGAEIIKILNKNNL